MCTETFRMCNLARLELTIEQTLDHVLARLSAQVDCTLLPEFLAKGPHDTHTKLKSCHKHQHADKMPSQVKVFAFPSVHTSCVLSFATSS